jgi:hypothetical protein
MTTMQMLDAVAELFSYRSTCYALDVFQMYSSKDLLLQLRHVCKE